MVARKTSLPYPRTPTSPPLNTESFGPSQPHFGLDSSNIPPVPTAAMSKRHEWEDTRNPWADPSEGQDQKSLPSILSIRNGQPLDNSSTRNQQDIPNILKPGWSGQDTPRSSLDSQRSRDFWDDDESPVKDQGEGKAHPYQRPNLQPPPQPPSPNTPANAVKRKPVALGNMTGTGNDLNSTNPFRRGSAEPELNYNPPTMYSTGIDMPDWSSEGLVSEKGKQPERDPPGLPQSSADAFAGLSLKDRQQSIPPFTHEESVGDEWWDQEASQHTVPPQPQAPPPPPPPPHNSQLGSSQPPLILVSPKFEHDQDPWDAPPHAPPTPSPVPFKPSQKHDSEYNDTLLGRGQESGVVSLGDELRALPNAAGSTSTLGEQHSLLDSDDEVGPPLPTRPKQMTSALDNGEVYADDDDVGPPLPTRPRQVTSAFGNDEAHAQIEGAPPPKPPRPAVVTSVLSDAEIAKLQEQRSETYRIKHFNWYDHLTGRSRRSSMLIQNKNGPCPLLALVNALILGAGDQSQATMDDALRSREQVSLGLIIETLMDELLTRGYNTESGSLPDLDELNSFLIRLRTGMNANPRFIAETTSTANIMDARNSMLHLPQNRNAGISAGPFEPTTDIKLYGAFGIPLMHGWLPPPGQDFATAFARSAQNYEDAQAIQFAEEELDYKLTHGGLSNDEQRVWEDITSIKHFLQQYSTQLTPYGLERVRESLSPGTFAILFRNDHFSTIYKHVENGNLYCLITDAGYADRDEIIWESLVDTTGHGSEFFSGDFMPIGHDAAASSTQRVSPTASGRRISQQADFAPASGPMSPQERQEQHDADFAMALQMQEEEEQRVNQARRRPGGNTSSNTTGNRQSTGNSPRPHIQQQQSARPLIPPRTARSENPGVSRPVDSTNEDAPPTYEDAARDKPYNPPLGSPLHPHADPSPASSSTQLTGTISRTSGSSPHPLASAIGRRQPGRRISAYAESNGYLNSPNPYAMDRRTSYGMSPVQAQGPNAAPGLQGNHPGQDRDCSVM